MSWMQGEVTSDGVTLHYHRTGGEKPTCVLLHGVTDNGLCWSRVARDLEAEYDLVMPDARGHGRSGRVTSRFSIDHLADDVAAIIRALELAPAALYGHSLGADTAVAAAARYPELVRAVVLEDPPLRAHAAGPSDEQLRASAREWLTELRQLPREELIRRRMADDPGWDKDEVVPCADAKAEFDLAVLEHYQVSATYPWRAALARITCPILLITGDPEQGAIVTPEVAREAEEIWHDGRVVHIAGAGHSIHRDRYDDTIAAVRGFLAST